MWGAGAEGRAAISWGAAAETSSWGPVRREHALDGSMLAEAHLGEPFKIGAAVDEALLYLLLTRVSTPSPLSWPLISQ